LPVVNLEARGRDYLAFGEDNLFPQETANLALTPTHGAILKSIASFTYGAGFVWDRSFPQINAFFENARNGVGDLLNDVLRKVVHDYAVHGGFYLLLRPGGIGNARIGAVDFLPFEQMRVKANEDGDVVGFVRSYNWARYNKNKAKTYVPFDPSTFSNSEGQVLYKWDYNAALGVYPIPNYWGIKEYIQLDKAIGVFYKNTIRNGLMPSAVVNVLNVPDGEKREAIAKMIRDEYTSEENAAKFFLIFTEPNTYEGAQGVQVTPFATGDNANMFNEVHTQTVQQICSGHRFPPSLAGVSNGSLSITGNSEELTINLQIAQANIFDPYKQFILRAFRQIATFNGLRFDFDIATNLPADVWVSPNLLALFNSGVITLNELRSEIGLRPMALTDVPAIAAADPNTLRLPK
jgi:hypothetical protein